MTALTSDELVAWVETTSVRWRELLTTHSEILEMPCDVRETTSAAGLLQHIVAVELRYAERLAEMPATAYEAIPKDSVEQLYATHDRAMLLLRTVLERDGVAWEEAIEFPTRSAGTLRAARRVVMVHMLMHSIRHYAQLATLVRQHGIAPGWAMDYLFMDSAKE